MGLFSSLRHRSPAQRFAGALPRTATRLHWQLDRSASRTPLAIPGLAIAFILAPAWSPGWSRAVLNKLSRGFRWPAVNLICLSVVASGFVPGRADSTEWYPSERLHPDTPFDETAPDIAVGPNGNPVAVWELGDIWWSYWKPECECWTTPDLVNQPNTLADEYPRVSVGGDNVPWVVWSQNIGAYWVVLATRHVNGVWTPPDTVVAPSGSNDVFDIVAVDEDDAWVASDGLTVPTGSQPVILVRHFEGGAWVEYGPLTAELAPNHSDTLPRVARDTHGDLWVTWTHRIPVIGAFAYVSRLDGGQWSMPDSMPGQARVPNLAALEAERMLITWNTHFDIKYRFWEDGWGQTGTVSAADGVQDWDFSACAGGWEGQPPVVVWVAGPEQHAGLRDIIASEWNGSSWSSEQIISIPDSVEATHDLYPQVAVGPDGMAWAVWIRWGPYPQQQDNDIWFARGQLGGNSSSIVEEGAPQSDWNPIVRPNPSLGFATVEFSVPRAGVYEAVVVDAVGNVVDLVRLGELAAGIQSGEHSFRWPTLGRVEPASGIYFVQFRDAGSRQTLSTAKFVLIR